MALHVGFGQFDANGETLHHQDDSGKFQSDEIGIAPFEGINQIRGVRAKDDATNGGYGSFANVEFFLDEEGYQHKNTGETAQNDVDQVRLGNGKMIPGHGGRI